MEDVSIISRIRAKMVRIGITFVFIIELQYIFRKVDETIIF